MLSVGRALGLMCIILGGLLSLIAYSMLHQGAGVTFRGFMVGPTLLGGGLGFVLRPGGAVTFGELLAANKTVKDYLIEASTLDKASWVGLALIGTLAGMKFLALSGN